MDIPTVNILGIPIHQMTRTELFSLLQERKEADQSTWVVTVNAELVMRAREKQQVADALQQADLLLADGSGIVWAARALGSYLPERLPGIEVAEGLVKWAAVAGLTMYFLGAQPGVAEEAIAKLWLKYPELEVVGHHHGYFQEAEAAGIIAEICSRRPDILLVALGAPRQELWLARHFADLGTCLAVGVGGSLDVWSGRVKRAPAWMGDRGLEWLYRLVTQPQRAGRMLALPRFVYQVMRAKMVGR